MFAEEPKKRRNRTKNNEATDQRNFECTCGRKYLSYSALYTHSKQKHGVTISTKNIDSLNDKNQENCARQNIHQDTGKRNNYNDQKNSQNQQKTDGNNKGNGYCRQTPNNQKNPTIQKVLIQFMSTQDLNLSESQRTYINKVFTCMVLYVNAHPSHLEIYNSPGKYCQNRGATFLPFIFNEFYHQEVPKLINAQNEELKQTILKILGVLGEWLFKKKYSPFQVQRIYEIQ